MPRLGFSTSRRHSLLAGAAGAFVLLAAIAPLPGGAQPGPAAPQAREVRPLDAATFVRLAHSSATVQARAAGLAANRDTRPEAKAFAQKMVEFRRGQIPKLEAAARDNKVAVPALPDMEHRLIVENLEPLDFLALSRRYAEFQIQALEQEILIYAGAARGPDDWARSLAAETSADLSRLLEEARTMRQAVGP
jgi:predicted outer membrane protein